MFLEYAQAVCWVITYVLLVIYALKYKQHGIPLLPIVLNFSWETVALAGTLLWNLNMVSFFMHGLWFTLDLIIIILYILKEKSVTCRERILFCVKLFLSFGCFAYAYMQGYAILMAYIIDFIMAFEYIRFALFHDLKKGRLSFYIGFFRLWGDLFAWINCYGWNAPCIVVLMCNILYLFILLNKKKDSPPFVIAIMRND